MIQYVELGQFVMGRKGKKIRIAWNSDAYEMFNKAIEKYQEIESINNEETYICQEEEIIDTLNNDSEKEDANEKLCEAERSVDLDKKVISIKNKECIYPTITINVDMSQWREEKN